MQDLHTQLAYAIRCLRKSPGFALSALAILTLGIGANTAIFGIVNAVLLKPFPFPDPDRIVHLWHVPPQHAFPGMKTFAVSLANYLDWRKQSTAFESMALVGGGRSRIGGGAQPEAVASSRVEADFFKVLGVQPAAGRVFTPDENQPGRGDVVVLSNAFAQNHFDSASAAVGRTLEVDGKTVKVIGVMPPEFGVKSWFPTRAGLWRPLEWTPKEAATRGNHNYIVIARLKRGVSVDEARSQMNTISERLARDYPEEDKGWGATVITLREDIVGDVQPALLTLLGAVGFVLLIACANTGNLALARTIARKKELAIRAALGASAGQVLRPVLLETLVLSVAGGALGLLFARSAQALVVKALADKMPRAVEVGLDGRVLAFTVFASVLTGLLAGALACWRLHRADLNDSLKQGLGKTDAYASGRRTRSALVVAEVAMSLVLLVGAGLMVRSLWALRGVDPGFSPANVATVAVPVAKNEDAAKRNRLYDEFLPRVRSIPGVTAAGGIDNLPLSGGGSQQPFTIEGRPAEVFAMQPTVAVRQATPGYIGTMRIRLVAGRDFNQFDTAENRPPVLISESMARQYWPGESAVGKRLKLSFSPEVVREVVGVVGDVKERGLDVLEPVPMLYIPLAQNYAGPVSLVARGDRDAAALGSTVARALREVDPELPIREVGSLEELAAESLAQFRFSMWLFVALACLAFALAAVGIYSVLAYNVRTRVQEIGIRMALGAEVGDVLSMVVVQGMRPAVIGIVFGAFGSWLLSGILAKLIFGVSATDPATFVATAALLAGVALVACLLPAYRATRVEPVSALRNE